MIVPSSDRTVAAEPVAEQDRACRICAKTGAGISDSTSRAGRGSLRGLPVRIRAKAMSWEDRKNVALASLSAAHTPAAIIT